MTPFATEDPKLLLYNLIYCYTEGAGTLNHLYASQRKRQRRERADLSRGSRGLSREGEERRGKRGQKGKMNGDTNIVDLMRARDR